MNKFRNKDIKIIISSPRIGLVIIQIYRRGRIIYESESNTSDELYISFNKVKNIINKYSRVSAKWFNRILQQ